MVDENRVEGLGHQIKGALKDVAGKVTGDTSLEAEGKAEKAGGHVQEGVGKGKDAVRDVVGS